MSKPPAVQFYAGDFLTGTTLMTNEEVGLYIRLLCLQVENGSVPDDPERMALVYGPQVPKLWPAVRAKFVAGPEPGTMVNVKMGKVLEDRAAYRLKQSEKGKASAEARSNSGSKNIQPRSNHGSTTVEPLGGRGRGNTQKGKEPAHEDPVKWPSWAGEHTLAAWEEFKVYRWIEHKKSYKSTKTEQRAVDILSGYFPSGERCVDALNYSMGKGWIFPVNPADHKYPKVHHVEETGWNPRA